MSDIDDRIPPIGSVSQAERLQATNWVSTLERSTGGAPILWPEFVARQGRSVRIIDVREPDELVGPLGHIPGAEWIPKDRVLSLVERLDRNAKIILVSRAGERSAAIGGGVFALAAMTRPEGPLLAALALAHLLAFGCPRWRSAGAFAAAFLSLWVPYTAWRVSYFGDFFPNTYYAKSAALSWWAQGWIYFRVYAQKYWALYLAIPAWIAARLRANSADRRADPAPEHLQGASLALAFLFFHTLYVIRIGGDFMFARMLLPVAPFVLVLLDQALPAFTGGRTLVAAGITAALAAGVLLTPNPVSGTDMVSGIANEPNFYTPERTASSRAHGEAMRPYIEGLPVRMVFMGGDARAVYYSRVETAIEGATGLTDRAIAHQPLPARARVGHEKTASIDYLLHRRKVNLLYSRGGMRALNLGTRIPDVPIAFGSHVAQLVRWEPELVREFVARGAQVGDFPAHLDEYFKILPLPPDSEMAQDYRKLKTFYFEPARDRTREQAFLEQMSRAGR